MMLAIMVIISYSFNSAFGQATVASNTLTGTAPNPNEYLGSSNGYHVIFKAANTERMRIDQSNGRVGIGVTAPNELLEVGGNIRIGSSNSFKLAGNKVLWHDGNTNDIFVGVSAGNTGMTGHANTLVGNSAGTALTSGAYNTHIGWNAGVSATTDSGTTFVGYEAGKSNTTANNNTAVGYQALHSAAIVGRNTAVGYQALYTNSTQCTTCDGGHTLNTAVGYQALYYSQAYGGCAVGFWAGFNNTTGCSLTAMGEEAARGNTTGNDNVAYGDAALHGNTSLSDNVAIGSGALQAQSYNGSVSTYNVAVGNHALYSNQPSSTTNGLYNTAIGHDALYSNTTGSTNVAGGYQAGYSNQTGNWNVYYGAGAGYAATGSYGTYIGYDAGVTTTSGLYNTFIGYGCGYYNQTGGSNTFAGLSAGSAITGSHSTGFGLQALGQTTSGQWNTAIGEKAGYANVTGDSNVFVGYTADANANNYHNCAAYGYGATTTGSGKFYFGNAGIIGLYTVASGLFAASDGRFKINVKENVSGLEFINKLRPVTYNMDTKALDAFINQNRQPTKDSLGNEIKRPEGDFSASTNMVRSGFIAQEIEQASKECGFKSTIVSAPSNSNDPYAVNYAEIVVPLVKAVQELNAVNTSLQKQIDALKTGDLQNSGSNDFPLKQTIDLASSDPILFQNQPNPFDNSTIIRYFISENSIQPKIIFQDETGATINETAITQKGLGSIQVNAATLNGGIYTYSLQVDGKIIDSKKMLKAK